MDGAASAREWADALVAGRAVALTADAATVTTAAVVATLAAVVANAATLTAAAVTAVTHTTFTKRRARAGTTVAVTIVHVGSTATTSGASIFASLPFGIRLKGE
jgi:3-keto-L-gulonate-6-phosphate decarboxylase